MTRYFFWKTPSGKAYDKNDGKYAPNELLAEIGKISSINNDGNVTWSGFSWFKLKAAINGASVIIGPNCEYLNSHDSWHILCSALKLVILDNGAGIPIPNHELLNKADILAAEHFSKPINNYVLICSLSIKSFPAHTINIHGCRIDPLRKRNDKYPYPEIMKLQNRGNTIIKHIESTNYKYIRIHTNGRTINEAADNGFKAINLLRGFWSLFATYGSWSISFGSTLRKPIGSIHLGPVSTLHNPDGSLVGENYWYEPDATEDCELFDPKNGWSILEKQRRWAMKRIQQLPYRRDIIDLIIRYINALDYTRHDIAFLQMWGMLEKITDTIGHNYDETIRRAVWIFRDRKIIKEMLECLRLHRNQFVHSAKTAEDLDQMCFLLKSFLDPHILRLIRNDYKIDSIEDYGKYLSLPTDLAVLHKYNNKLKRAINIMKLENKQTTVIHK